MSDKFDDRSSTPIKSVNNSNSSVNDINSAHSSTDNIPHTINNNTIGINGKDMYHVGADGSELKESDEDDAFVNNNNNSPGSGESTPTHTPKPEKKFPSDFRKSDVRGRPSRPASVKMFQFHLSPTSTTTTTPTAVAKPVDRKPSAKSLNPTGSFRSKIRDEEENLLKQMKSKSVVFEDLAQGLFAPIVDQEEVR